MSFKFALARARRRLERGGSLRRQLLSITRRRVCRARHPRTRRGVARGLGVGVSGGPPGGPQPMVAGGGTLPLRAVNFLV